MPKNERSEGTESSTSAQDTASLRLRALAKYLQTPALQLDNLAELSAADIAETFRELRVHQIELEMQNEELRQSQLELEESRARFRDLYDCAPVGYCLVRSDGQIHDANSTLGEMLGSSPSLLNKDRIYNVIDKSGQDVFYRFRRQILATLQPESCELRMKRSDGTSLWVQLSATVASTAGDDTCLRISLMNVDSRIRAETAQAVLEEQLRESQKMQAIGTLAGGIAHDFNNILAVVMVNAEVAVTGANDSTVPFLEEIQKAASRARELVLQLMAFCRKQPTNRHIISLADVTRDTIALLRSTMPARFELNFTCAMDVPAVFADGTQIEQVIINLASNAMQAMNGKAGQLHIQLDSIQLDDVSSSVLNTHSKVWKNCSRVVRMIFSDDGPGMEPGTAEKIFEPFFTTKPVNEGTGLGLAVVHGIVHAHDGEIFVKTQVGQGTTFTIYLPPAEQVDTPDSQSLVSAPPAPEPKQLPLQSDRQTFADCPVLYVDDDRWVLAAITRLLSEYGIPVSGYTDSATAFAALNDPSANFKVVVTDYNMPGLSGLEFAKQVRRLRPALPVVITSGFIDEDLRAHAQDAGILALMEKPFSSRRFIDLLTQIKQSSDITGLVSN